MSQKHPQGDEGQRIGPTAIQEHARNGYINAVHRVHDYVERDGGEQPEPDKRPGHVARIDRFAVH